MFMNITLEDEEKFRLHNITKYKKLIKEHPNTTWATKAHEQLKKLK